MAKERIPKLSILKNGHFVTLPPKEQAKLDSMQRALVKREAKKEQKAALRKKGGKVEVALEEI